MRIPLQVMRLICKHSELQIELEGLEVLEGLSRSRFI